MCLVSRHITGTPPLSGIPSCVWNPTHLLSGIPPKCPTATILLTVPYHPLAIAAPIWPLTAPYPLIWPLPAHHLELLLYATPLPPATAIWPSCTLPSPPSGPSGPPCPTAPTPSASLPSASYPTTPTIWSSCLTSPSNCHLALLPSGIPSLPSLLALLAPTPCPIWLPAIAPPAPTTSNPNLDLLPPHHQI